VKVRSRGGGKCEQRAEEVSNNVNRTGCGEKAVGLAEQREEIALSLIVKGFSRVGSSPIWSKITNQSLFTFRM